MGFLTLPDVGPDELVALDPGVDDEEEADERRHQALQHRRVALVGVGREHLQLVLLINH